MCTNVRKFEIIVICPNCRNDHVIEGLAHRFPKCRHHLGSGFYSRLNQCLKLVYIASGLGLCGIVNNFDFHNTSLLTL